jgi:predicted DNA binding CopG/RHH family protein
MMKTSNLDKEERDLVASFERGEWKSVENLEQEREQHRQIARNTLRKDKRVTVRISSKDFEDIRAIAAEDGIPYQTLISSVLRRFASGRLMDRSISAPRMDLTT